MSDLGMWSFILVMVGMTTYVASILAAEAAMTKQSNDRDDDIEEFAMNSESNVVPFERK